MTPSGPATVCGASGGAAEAAPKKANMHANNAAAIPILHRIGVQRIVVKRKTEAPRTGDTRA
jgi:hypothetical protein